MRLRKALTAACFLVIFTFSLISFGANAQQESWSTWLQGLRQEAIDQGIRPEFFDEIFQHIKQPNHSVLSLDHNQPEKRLTFSKYRSTRADNYRIVIGRKQYAKNKALLNEIGHKYGVNPCFIVSLWGLETSYGTFMGKFPVVQSLATLAYDPRRGKFFRKELLYALHILAEGHVSYADFKGEWAGASGQPQFLPSSWHRYAVDYDGDGKKDIWKSYPDAFASIANYLAQNGWKNDEPWAITVTVPQAAVQYENDKQARPLSEWMQLGLKTQSGQPWPANQALSAKLIHPYGGPDILVFNNFNVIMKWNRSNYYAATVGYLAEQICGKPIYDSN